MWDKQQTKKTKKLWKVNIWISQSATICSKTRRVWILTESSSTVSQSSLQQPLCITPKHTGWSLHNSQKLPARFISHPIYRHSSIFHPIFIAKNNQSFIGSLSSTIIHIWLVVYLPLWKMMEFVSWDDDIPNWMESHKSHVPNHQPVYRSIKSIWRYMKSQPDPLIKSSHLPVTTNHQDPPGAPGHRTLGKMFGTCVLFSTASGRFRHRRMPRYFASNV